MGEKMSGNEYADLLARYILTNYGDRGIDVYREICLGKTIIGKNRRIDIFIVQRPTHKAYAVECKYQCSQGTVDEKIPYAIKDMNKLPIKGCICYAGEGFSEGVLHMLEASSIAAYCLPDHSLSISTKTKEFDQLLAMYFGWWDVIVKNKEPLKL